jgi:hypothetical protein
MPAELENTRVGNDNAREGIRSVGRLEIRAASWDVRMLESSSLSAKALSELEETGEEMQVHAETIVKIGSVGEVVDKFVPIIEIPEVVSPIDSVITSVDFCLLPRPLPVLMMEDGLLGDEVADELCLNGAACAEEDARGAEATGAI